MDDFGEIKKTDTIEGWGSAPFDELYKLDKNRNIVILEKKIERKFLPIVEGDNGKQAEFATITIVYTGERW